MNMKFWRMIIVSKKIIKFKMFFLLTKVREDLKSLKSTSKNLKKNYLAKILIKKKIFLKEINKIILSHRVINPFTNSSNIIISIFSSFIISC